jgi:SNF2 family DNA or RNA helicase
MNHNFCFKLGFSTSLASWPLECSSVINIGGVIYFLLQAQARCHRIGQQKMVKVYRLLCRNTYEREMFDKASLKLGLDKALLQSMNTSQGKDHNNKQLSKKEIEDLLKKG